MPAFDKKDKNRAETFTRRTMLLTGGMTAVFAVLAGRLYQLQILEGEQYMTRAEDNRVNQRLLAPLRGRILDRFATPLASNRKNYRVVIIPEQTSEGMHTALDALAKVIPLPDHQRARLLKEAAQNRNFVPITVAENLSWDDFARLNLDLPYLPGVQPDVGETRDYPFGEEMSHVLGYVAPVSLTDKESDKTGDPLLDVPGFRIGKRGIESAFDTTIRGSAGASRVEVNAYGRVIRELGRDPGRAGDDVFLTLDCALQQFAYERIKDQSASCVMMDVENGDVLVFASTPGFDPNLFNTGITGEQWKSLTDNDHKPLINKAISGAYPPGSTFKTVTALAALDAGVIGPDFAVHCAGHISLGSHQFHCWKRGGHGRIDLRNGIKQSCDVFFYEVARRLGIDKLADAAKRLGLGAVTGIEIPGERSGLIPTQAWKVATFKEPWQAGETLNAGIGQGYTLVTPLQLCTLAARIAGGKKVSPRIVHSVGAERKSDEEALPLDFSVEALNIVRDGLFGVANEPGGTAYAWRIADSGLEMAGKTGTAQVRRITMEERARGVLLDAQLPWKLRDHGLFIAYAPVERPRYACAVVIEHGAAGHPQVILARDLLRFAQKRGTLDLPTAYPTTSAGNVSPAPTRQL